jgi:hypothetical protein
MPYLKLTHQAHWTPKVNLRAEDANQWQELEILLRQVREKDYSILVRKTKTGTGWQYVYDLTKSAGKTVFAARVEGKAMSQRWGDPQLCAAELWLIMHPETEMGTLYAHFDTKSRRTAPSEEAPTEELAEALAQKLAKKVLVQQLAKVKVKEIVARELAALEVLPLPVAPTAEPNQEPVLEESDHERLTWALEDVAMHRKVLAEEVKISSQSKAQWDGGKDGGRGPDYDPDRALRIQSLKNLVGDLDELIAYLNHRLANNITRPFQCPKPGTREYSGQADTYIGPAGPTVQPKFWLVPQAPSLTSGLLPPGEDDLPVEQPHLDDDQPPLGAGSIIDDHPPVDFDALPETTKLLHQENTYTSDVFSGDEISLPDDLVVLLEEVPSVPLMTMSIQPSTQRSPAPTPQIDFEQLAANLLAKNRRSKETDPDWQLHAYATHKARECYRDLLTGRDRSAEDQVKHRRVSIDYILCRSLGSYWFHWLSIRMGSYEAPRYHGMNLEDSICATETRKLLDNGIPSDFLFFEDDNNRPLYNTKDPNCLPATGFPITIEEAAFLVMLRPPTWCISTWAPPPAGAYGDESHPAPDLFMGFDPVKTHATGEITRLAIPSYLNERRYPVLTVPEAFMTWALAAAAAMGAISLQEIPFLSKRVAATRVFSTTGLGRVFGLNSLLEEWKSFKLNWDQRQLNGEPMEDIIADLGPPPTPPAPEVPDWTSHGLALKTATIRHLPFFVHWAALPGVIHDNPLAGAKPLDLLSEINSARPEVLDVGSSEPLLLEASVVEVVAFPVEVVAFPVEVFSTATLVEDFPLELILGPGPCPGCGEELDPVNGCPMCFAVQPVQPVQPTQLVQPAEAVEAEPSVVAVADEPVDVGAAVAPWLPDDVPWG